MLTIKLIFDGIVLSTDVLACILYQNQQHNKFRPRKSAR